VTITNSAQQIPNFTSKLITHTITILTIYNYVQKRNKGKKRGKDIRVRMIIPSYMLVHLNYASLKWCYIRLEEPSPLLLFKIKAHHFDVVKACKSSSKARACISE